MLYDKTRKVYSSARRCRVQIEIQIAMLVNLVHGSGLTVLYIKQELIKRPWPVALISRVWWWSQIKNVI